VVIKLSNHSAWNSKVHPVLQVTRRILHVEIWAVSMVIRHNGNGPAIKMLAADKHL